MTLLLIALASFVAWTISTVAAGGGAMLLIPVVTYLVGARAVAPVVTLTSLLGLPARVYLFRKHVNWRIVRWYLPGAVVGAFLGSWLFARTRAEWLQIIIALFLISTIWQYRFGERERAFEVRTWWFLPIGFGVSFVSGLVGATGEVLNAFYLNYGAGKEEIIATKSVNSFVMHVTKIGSYTAFGAVTGEYLLYGLVAGVAAIGANWLGRHWLRRLSGKRFRQLVIAIMVASGLAMLWDQRALLAAAWRGVTG